MTTTYSHVFAVRPTKKQKELANLVLLGKTRVGKGLNITTNLLTWPFPVVVNDIKREFWDQTAGWRERGLTGRSFMFDPRGLGHNSTPSRGRRPTRIFALLQRYCFTGRTRGRTSSSPSGPSPCSPRFFMLRSEKQRPLPFAYKILNVGLYGTATILKIISDKHNFYPHLAIKFLDISDEQADFDSKFLQDCYSTMTARINNILNKETVRCFTVPTLPQGHHHLR